MGKFTFIMTTPLVALLGLTAVAKLGFGHEIATLNFSSLSGLNYEVSNFVVSYIAWFEVILAGSLLAPLNSIRSASRWTAFLLGLAFLSYVIISWGMAESCGCGGDSLAGTHWELISRYGTVLLMLTTAPLVHFIAETGSSQRDNCIRRLNPS